MAAAGRNGPHGEPFIWLLRVGSLIKDPPSNWIHFLPGVRGVWGFKTPEYCCDVSSRHRSINRAFKEHTHSLLAKADLIGCISLASDRTDRRRGKMLPMGISVATRIAAINVDLMTTVTMTTVGARRRCPRTQEHCRGSGVAPDPDKWLAMRTVSAGGGHGLILLGKSEAGGRGSIASTQRPANS